MIERSDQCDDAQHIGAVELRLRDQWWQGHHIADAKAEQRAASERRQRATECQERHAANLQQQVERARDPAIDLRRHDRHREPPRDRGNRGDAHGTGGTSLAQSRGHHRYEM